MEDFKPLPRWVDALSAYDGALHSYNDWIDGRIREYENLSAHKTSTFDQVLGIRYAIGEMESQKALVNFIPEEEARLQHGTIRTVEDAPRRKRRRRRSRNNRD